MLSVENIKLVKREDSCGWCTMCFNTTHTVEAKPLNFGSRFPLPVQYDLWPVY